MFRPVTTTGTGSQSPRPGLLGRAGVAGLLAVAVIALTFVGVTDNLPSVVRGLAQAGGTAAGIALGARWQGMEEKTSIEGTARSALANLVALANGIRLMIATTESFREHANPTPRTVEALRHSSETLLTGLDNQARMALAQTGAAAASWLPFVADAEEYLSNFTETEARP